MIYEVHVLENNVWVGVQWTTSLENAKRFIALGIINGESGYRGYRIIDDEDQILVEYIKNSDSEIDIKVNWVKDGF